MSNGPIARATAVNVPTTAKTAILTITGPGLSLNTEIGRNTGQNFSTNGPQICIDGTANFTPGTGATSVAVSLADETGTAVGTTQNIGVTAGVPLNISFTFADQRGQTTNHVYTLSLQQTAATANGTVNEIVGQAGSVTG